jgi:peroxiredoxin
MVPLLTNRDSEFKLMPRNPFPMPYIQTMKSWTRVFAAIACTAIVASSFAQAGPASDAAKTIFEGIRKLRSLSDTDRVGATKSLATQIAGLPAGAEKLDLAYGLANLSTEGDFGRDTLQSVTDTLVQAVKEAPPAREKPQNAKPDDNGRPAGPYGELAQLATYEHMKVDLDAPDYKEALTDLAALDTKRAAADFTLTDLNGKSWTLSSLKGKVVIVNFWATWCPPCRKEMPDLETIYNKYKDQGLVVLGISDEDLTKVAPFIKDHKYDYPIMLDPGRKVNSVYQIEGIPKNFIYNREGKMVAQSIDMRTMGQFMEMLKLAGIKE